MFVDAILYYYYTIQSIIEATIIKPYSITVYAKPSHAFVLHYTLCFFFLSLPRPPVLLHHLPSKLTIAPCMGVVRTETSSGARKHSVKSSVL
jgi:hypothetical protein